MRDKAKVVLVLMEDDEKLKEEREFAVKTREKTSKSAAGKPFFYITAIYCCSNRFSSLIIYIILLTF